MFEVPGESDIVRCLVTADAVAGTAPVEAFTEEELGEESKTA
jgi:hypothetical protein